MVVVAIIGIMAGLAIAGFQRIGARLTPQSAVSEFTGALSAARMRAMERSGEVWVVIYPQGKRGAATGGGGAYFVYEDQTLGFKRASTTPDGGTATNSYATFSPTALPSTSGGGRLTGAVYLDEYTGGGVAFGLVPTSVDAGYAAPFSGLTAQDCSFCDGNPRRGAIVFAADGSARLVGSGGAPNTADKASLAIKSRDGARQYLIALSTPTSYVSVTSP